MPEISLKQKKQEFKENFNVMTESDKGLAAYISAFSDQTNAEKLLATGGGEDLGSIEDELAALSAMNEIRISERQQAFTEDKLFAADVMLSMRDKGYIEAAGELNRRKKIKSHRYDKTRKSRMETAQETMTKANDRIRALKNSLKGENGPAPTRMQKVRSMEEIYDSIRVADRNFAEAMALNKLEENKLKTRAELTYRSSLKRMYEREMEGLPQNSDDYRKIKRKYDENLTYYNELMRPILEERARREENDNRRELNKNVRRDAGNLKNADNRLSVRPKSLQANKELNLKQNAPRQSVQPKEPQPLQTLKQPKLLDAEAEENVSTNVKLFSKFLATLGSTKYGRTADASWNDMKTKAGNLTAGWENMTDIQRGQALADILVSANKFLCKDNLNSSVNKERANAAKQFRDFFKTTLGSMSRNCRVLALDEIYRELDRIEDDPKADAKLKKANEVVFTEMAREKYKEQYAGEAGFNEAVKNITAFHYRMNHYSEKDEVMADNVLRAFGNTKDFFLADLKFSLARFMSEDLLADNFRVDRFGKVLAEDRNKYEQWKKLLSDIAKCDTEGALKMQRQWVQRFINRKLDKDFLNEKGILRKGYELKTYRVATYSIQNTEQWTDTTLKKKDLDKAISQWNASHKNAKDKIQVNELKSIDVKKLKEQRKKLQKLPGVSGKEDVNLLFESEYIGKIFDMKGCDTSNLNFQMNSPEEILDMKAFEGFVKNGTTAYATDETMRYFIHRNGQEFNTRQDVNRKNRKLVNNKQNPLILRQDYYKPKIEEELKKKAPLTEKIDVEKEMQRVGARENRINTVERGAMGRLKELVKNKKLGSAGQNELRELEALFEEYAKEAGKQIYEREALLSCDKDMMEKDKLAINGIAKIYHKQRKNMNDLFDRLEKAQSDFIKKYAGEASYLSWKARLDNERKESRKNEDKGALDGLSAIQRIMFLSEDEWAGRAANEFTEEEEEIIRGHVEGAGRQFQRDEVDRVANTFILPVHRDFTGAFLTEQDRYNDSFNKRFKAAVLNNDTETQKALSREFTENVLKKMDDPMTPEEIEKIDTLEKLEKKYTAKLIGENNIQLRIIDNVMKNNQLLPDMKAGLEELRTRNKKQYDALEKKCDARSGATIGYVLMGFGYNPEKHNYVDENGREQFKAISQGFIEDLKSELEKENKAGSTQKTDHKEAKEQAKEQPKEQVKEKVKQPVKDQIKQPVKQQGKNQTKQQVKKPVKKEQSKENLIINEDSYVIDESYNQENLKSRYMKSKKGVQAKFKTKCEKQGTYNCFACSGTALLNQYIANKTGKNRVTRFTKKDMRNIKAGEYVQKYEDVKDIFGSEEEYELEVDRYKANIGENTAEFNGIFELADFFLKQDPELEVHQQTYEVAHNDPVMLESQKKLFVSQIESVLKTQNLVSLLIGKHFVTITGIKGDIVEYMDSDSDETNKVGAEIKKPAYATVDHLFHKDVAGNYMGLVWLSKMEDPNKLAREYDNIGINEKGFYAKKKNTDNVYDYNLMHSMGVDGKHIRRNGVLDQVYVNKNFDLKKYGQDNRNLINVIEEEDEDLKSEASINSNIIDTSTKKKEGKSIISEEKIKTKKNEIPKEQEKTGKNVILEEKAKTKKNEIKKEKEKTGKKGAYANVKPGDVMVRIEENSSYQELNKLEPGFSKKSFEMYNNFLRLKDIMFKDQVIIGEFKKVPAYKNKGAEEFSRGDIFMMKPVKYDPAGKPLSDADKINREWNIKWLKSLQNNDPVSMNVRENMLSETLGHLLDGIKLPPAPTEKQKKNPAGYKTALDNWIEKNVLTSDNFQKMMFADLRVGGADNLKDKMPAVKKFYDDNKDLEAKENLLHYVCQYVRDYIKRKYCVDLEKGLLYRKSADKDQKYTKDLEEVHFDAVIEGFSQYQDTKPKKELVKYKKTVYDEYADVKKGDLVIQIKPNATFEKLHKVCPEIKEEGFKAYLGYKKSFDFKTQDREMREEYEKIPEEIMKVKKTSIERDMSYVMKQVRYDDNGIPLTKKDRENREWNLRWLRAWQKNDPGSKKQRESMVQEQIGKSLDGFKLPKLPTAAQLKDPRSYMHVLQQWITDVALKGENYEKMWSIASRDGAYDQLSKMMPSVKKFGQDNEAFMRKAELVSALMQLTDAYVRRHYGVSIQAGNVPIPSENAKEQNREHEIIAIQTVMEAFRKYMAVKSKAMVPYVPGKA